MESEQVTEIPSNDLTAGDWAFIGGTALVFCLVAGFLFKSMRKTFKNVHVKIGDKFEVGVETKEEKE